MFTVQNIAGIFAEVGERREGLVIPGEKKEAPEYSSGTQNAAQYISVDKVGTKGASNKDGPDLPDFFVSHIVWRVVGLFFPRK